jgi:hypothetical protein
MSVETTTEKEKVSVERKKERKHKQTQPLSYFLSGWKNITGMYVITMSGASRCRRLTDCYKTLYEYYATRE